MRDFIVLFNIFSRHDHNSGTNISGLKKFIALRRIQF